MLDQRMYRRWPSQVNVLCSPLHKRLVLAVLMTFAGCSAPPSDAPQLVLTGGMIYPLGLSDEPASAIAIRDDTILAVGTDQEILALADDYTQQMRLEESAVLPGSFDAWIDVEALGRWNGSPLDLRLASTVEEVQAMVRNAAGADPAASGWLVGWGWSESDWPDPVLPGSPQLDDTGVSRPVALLRRSGRVAWLNSVALAALGDAALRTDPPGGRIARTAEGSPSGILLGTALDLLDTTIPSPPADLRRAWIGAGVRAAAAAGITRIATAPLDADAVEYLLELAAQSILPIRVDVRVTPDALQDLVARNLEAQLQRSALVQLVAVGLRIDGALTGRLAAVSTPYEGTEERGILYADEQMLAAAIDAARTAGLAVHLQAEGDRALETALAGLGDSAPPGSLVAGVDLPASGLAKRLGAAGIGVAISPARFSRDVYWLEHVLGEDRAAGAHPWSDLASEGVRLSLASDAPANNVGPLLALAAAATRQNAAGYPATGWHPDQALEISALLRTLVNAEPGGGEPPLRIGAPADLVVWSDNPVTGGRQALLRAQAMLTIVAGRVAYSRALVDVPMTTKNSR